MQSAEKQSCHVRGDQTNEADRSGERGGGANEQRGGDDCFTAHTRDRHTQMRGLVFTELQSVERTGVAPKEEGTDTEER